MACISFYTIMGFFFKNKEIDITNDSDHLTYHSLYWNTTTVFEFYYLMSKFQIFLQNKIRWWGINFRYKKY